MKVDSVLLIDLIVSVYTQLKSKRPNLKVQPECYIELLFFYY